VQGVFDAYAPLKRLGPTEYVKARMVKSSRRRSRRNAPLRQAEVMGDDGAIYGDIDKKGFLGAMQELKGEHDRFFMWIAGNRAKRLMNEGREHLFTKDEINRHAGPRRREDGRRHLAHRSLRQGRRDAEGLQQGGPRHRREDGLIDGESRHLWEHDFYVPFFRVGDDMKIDGPVDQGEGTRPPAGVQETQGREEPLGDLMANTLQNWSHLLSASMANQAAVASLKAAKKVGIAEEVPEGTKGATYAMENGQKVHYAVDDPFILSAISRWSRPRSRACP
jgi:hypothetical protein